MDRLSEIRARTIAAGRSKDAEFDLAIHAPEDIPYLLEQINIATARAKKAEAELCQCCRAFSDATGHGWDENCEVCKFGPLPEPPEMKQMWREW